MKISAYVTNLGLYNEGYLCGEWVTFPIDEDEERELMDRIKIDEFHEEYFITDYETDISGLEIGEYTSIASLNEMAEALEDLSDYDAEIVEALIGNGYDLEDAISRKDDCMVYSDCYSMADVAEQYAEETGLLDSIPENLRFYFDFEAFGRDMSFEGEFIFTSSGNCIEVLR